MQLAFDSSEELGGAEGLGLVPGAVTALRPGGLKLPHIGWNEVDVRLESRAARGGAAAALRLLPRALLRGAAGAIPATRSAPPSTASASSPPCAAAPSTASSSTRRSPRPPGCGCSATSRGSAPGIGRPQAPCCRRPRAPEEAALRLYPAIDILDGSAVRLRRGDFDASTVYDSDPLEAARKWVARRRGVAARRRPRRRPRGRAGQPRRSCAGSPRTAGFPCSTAAGCARHRTRWRRSTPAPRAS